MAASNVAQRSYLESRRQALLVEQAVWYHRAITARNQAADMLYSRSHTGEAERYRQLALEAQSRCDQLGRAIRAIDAELGAQPA